MNEAEINFIIKTISLFAYVYYYMNLSLIMQHNSLEVFKNNNDNNNEPELYRLENNESAFYLFL